MPEEIGNTLQNLKEINISEYGDLKIYSGELKNNQSSYDKVFISLAWSGWGKVSAARAITRILNSEKKIDFILFTGVAGAANSKLNQWDVLISEEVIQHDMDASPIFDRFVLPPLKKAKLKPNKKLKNWILNTLKRNSKKGLLKNFGNISTGLIATGDSFITDKDKIDSLIQDIPGLQAIEMEGAEVAEQENIPWVIIRIISDSADSKAADDFDQFIKIYARSSWEILESIFREIPKIKCLEN